MCQHYKVWDYTNPFSDCVSGKQSLFSTLLTNVSSNNFAKICVIVFGKKNSSSLHIKCYLIPLCLALLSRFCHTTTEFIQWNAAGGGITRQGVYVSFYQVSAINCHCQNNAHHIQVKSDTSDSFLVMSKHNNNNTFCWWAPFKTFKVTLQGRAKNG